MYTLKIEHSIGDFATWQAAFHRDPARREEAGVRQYRVCRPPDDARYVLIDLDFATAVEAQAFLKVLQEQVWRRAELSPGLLSEGTPPRARVVEEVDRRDY